MSVLSFHGSADDPRSLRVVDDRFHWSILLFAPLALLGRRQWGLFLLWLALYAAIVAAVAWGVLRPWAGVLLVLLAQWALALEAPEALRRRLDRRGLPPFALIGSGHAAILAASAPPPPRPARRRFALSRLIPSRRDERPVSSNQPVLGVFPEPGDRA